MTDAYISFDYWIDSDSASPITTGSIKLYWSTLLDGFSFWVGKRGHSLVGKGNRVTGVVLLALLPKSKQSLLAWISFLLTGKDTSHPHPLSDIGCRICGSTAEVEVSRTYPRTRIGKHWVG